MPIMGGLPNLGRLDQIDGDLDSEVHHFVT